MDEAALGRRPSGELSWRDKNGRFVQVCCLEMYAISYGDFESRIRFILEKIQLVEKKQFWYLMHEKLRSSVFNSCALESDSEGPFNRHSRLST